MDNVTPEGVGGMVKTFVTGLLGTALGMAITYSTSVADLRTETVRLATKIEALDISIKENMNDRYRGSDAAKDFSRVSEKINTIVEKNLELKKEIQDHIHNERLHESSN